MSKEKGKVKRKLTFNLDIELEEDLYNKLSEYSGAGVEVLAEHYDFFRKYNGRMEDLLKRDGLQQEETKELLKPEKDKEQEISAQVEKVVVDEYKDAVDTWLDDPYELLDKADEVKNSGENFILHIIGEEVLSELEYQKRVWRPHFELDNERRDEISTLLYGTSNPELKRRAAIDHSKRYDRSGFLRGIGEMRAYEDSKRRFRFLDTIITENE